METTSTISLDNVRFLIRLFCTLVSIGLVILSIYGFKQLGKSGTSLAQVEASTTSGCLSFLGLVFGLLLFFSETQIETFFVYFGFLRYRIGRAIIYTVTGIMVLVLGRTYGKQCDCSDFVPMIVEGCGCIIAAIIQFISTFVLEGNTAPQVKQDDSIITTQRPSSYYKSNTNTKQDTAAAAAAAPQVVMTISEPTISQVPSEETMEFENPNMPSWMKN